MQIVIDITEETYNCAKNGTFDVHYSPYDLLDIIKNGTPLPKGHGKLKDVDAFVPDCQEQSVYYDDDEYNVYTAVGISQIECAPTIIEADKESEDK